MNNVNPSRNLAAHPRARYFLVLLKLFGMPTALTVALLMLFLAVRATASAQVGALLASITNLANGDIHIQFSGGVPEALYAVEESSNVLTWMLSTLRWARFTGRNSC